MEKMSLDLDLYKAEMVMKKRVFWARRRETEKQLKLTSITILCICVHISSSYYVPRILLDTGNIKLNKVWGLQSFKKSFLNP